MSLWHEIIFLSLDEDDLTMIEIQICLIWLQKNVISVKSSFRDTGYHIVQVQIKRVIVKSFLIKIATFNLTYLIIKKSIKYSTRVFISPWGLCVNFLVMYGNKLTANLLYSIPYSSISKHSSLSSIINMLYLVNIIHIYMHIIFPNTYKVRKNYYNFILCLASACPGWFGYKPSLFANWRLRHGIVMYQAPYDIWKHFLYLYIPVLSWKYVNLFVFFL